MQQPAFAGFAIHHIAVIPIVGVAAGVTGGAIGAGVATVGIAGFVAYGAYKYSQLSEEEKRTKGFWGAVFGSIAEIFGCTEEYARNKQIYMQLIYWTASVKKCVEGLYSVGRDCDEDQRNETDKCNLTTEEIDFCLKVLDHVTECNMGKSKILDELNQNLDSKKSEILETGILLRRAFIGVFKDYDLYFPGEVEEEDSYSKKSGVIPIGRKYPLTKNDTKALQTASMILISFIECTKEDMKKGKDKLNVFCKLYASSIIACTS